LIQSAAKAATKRTIQEITLNRKARVETIQLPENAEASTIATLRRCIILVLDLFGKDTGSIEDMLIGGSLADELLHFEGLLIKRALDQADGSLTGAARLLGMTHQGLAWSLNHKHKHLLRSRKPPRRRYKSIIKSIKQ
jgi:transcriptional regulator with GAF, ATPase, and Fis domain